MKNAQDTPWIFKDFGLTEINTIKNRNKIKGLGLYTVLTEFLKDYGIYYSGATWLKNNNGEDLSTQVGAIFINPETFILDNELVIRQMYGWEDASVYIFLSGENASGQFLYNLDDYSCVFDEKKFDSMTDLFEVLKIETHSIVEDRSYFSCDA